MSFTDPVAIRDYVLAGKATITLESEVTGKHYTYRVTKKEEEGKDAVWFVGLLTGPENETDYSYIGLIRDNSFQTRGKVKVSPDAPSSKGFGFFWHWIGTGAMPPKMVIRHEGRCGRCGRTLTVPESIDTGIGPECRAKMGV